MKAAPKEPPPFKPLQIPLSMKQAQEKSHELYRIPSLPYGGKK